jgi:hypothetical protein
MASTTVKTGLLRQAVLAAVGYIAIMAVGMFTTGHVFGITMAIRRWSMCWCFSRW